MSKSIKNLILPYIILIVFCIYQRLSLVNMSINSIAGDTEAVPTSIIIGFVAFIAIYILFNRKHLNFRSKDGIGFTAFVSYVYVLSLILTLFVPFSTKSCYFYIIYPLACFYFTQVFISKINDMRYILYPCVIILGVLIYQYSVSYQETALLVNYTTSNNSAYFLLFFLPIVLCLDNKYLKWILVGIISFAVFASFKRGCVIALVTTFVTYYYYQYVKGKGGTRGFISILMLLALLLYAGYSILNSSNDIFSHLVSRFANIGEDGGSGRSDVYKVTWDMIISSDLLSLLFGHGWNMVIRDSPMSLSAHNDYMECLYDFGIIGFVLFMKLIHGLIKYVKTIHESRFYAPFAASIALLITTSAFAHVVIYTSYFSILAMFWSIAINSNKYSNL